MLSASAVQLRAEAQTTVGRVRKSLSSSADGGRTVRWSFGVDGNGDAAAGVDAYLDDVSPAGSGGSPTPAPTATPSGGPTASATPSASPTATPTAVPAATPSPTNAAFACDDGQFLTDQSAFGAGTIAADQLVDICGSVTRVLPEKTTSSGTHGYFYVALPSGYAIEIVSNLDAMAQAPTDRPPSTWPWVSAGQYAYVQGRYYYDSANSQGVDWTEDDTGSSWPNVGYVAVCNASGASCAKYW